MILIILRNKVKYRPERNGRQLQITYRRKKDKLYCICKKKYDATKFYVGCDVCNEWFHGACVSISMEKAYTMNEFICDGCMKSIQDKEIFCVCKQPYDVTQFYVGCDICLDWFHGHCVGILRNEVAQTEQYSCPRCSPTSRLNKSNFKHLDIKDYKWLKKVIRQLLGNRYAAPFKEPVNPSEVPNYYNVVKVPMDLQTIDQRLGQKYYKTLGEFIGDVMRIFENCRFFNPENSPITKSADNLENYFIQKLALLREKVSTSEN